MYILFARVCDPRHLRARTSADRRHTPSTGIPEGGGESIDNQKLALVERTAVCSSCLGSEYGSAIEGACSALSLVGPTSDVRPSPRVSSPCECEQIRT